MSPYTKLSVRTLGPATGLTLEAHRQVPTHVPNSPSRGTRKHGNEQPDGEWQDRALCKGESREYGSVWLYPSKHPRSDVNAAAAKCWICPVKAECEQQPRPHVGITAGRIHWDGQPSTEIRLCVQCLEPMQRRGRFCTNKCKDRWYYVVRLREGEKPFKPLVLWFGNKPISTIAKACGVAVRTVYRWDEAGSIPGGSVKQIAHRLEVDVKEIWPSSTVVQTNARSTANVGRDISGPGDASTSRDPAEPTEEVQQ